MGFGRKLMAGMLSVVLAVGLCPGLALADDLSVAGPVGLQAAEDETFTVNLEVTYGQTEARSMLQMINDFRKGSEAWAWNEDDTEKVAYTGLTDLAYDYELEKLAMYRAAELALSFSHTMLDGGKANGELSGISDWGENIAAGQTTAEAAFVSWREDNDKYSGQGHRRNMLKVSFNAVGIGHVVCNGTHYWVQEFGSPVLGNTETTADDSTRTVQLTMQKSQVTERSATATPSSIELHPGESVDLPSITASLGTAETWPGTSRPVSIAAPTWASGNPSVATVANGKVVAGAVGSTTLTTSVSLDEKVSVSVPVTVKAWDLSSATIGKISDIIATGKALAPALDVKLGSTALKENVDYVATFKDNVDAGTATALITGKGNYTGTKSTTFKINPAKSESSDKGNSSSATNTSKNSQKSTAATNTTSSAKKANTLKAKAKTVTVKYKKLKKKMQKVAAKKAFTVSKAKGAVTYKVSMYDKKAKKKITVSKSGKVTVKKGLKKGTYKVKVKVKAAGNKTYNSATKTVTLKVKVK